MKLHRKISCFSSVVTVALLIASSGVQAKLPAPSPEAKAKAEEAKAKTAWSDKVAAFQLCKAQDRVAAHYQKDKNIKPAASTAACADPGPYVPPDTAAAAPAPGAVAPVAAAVVAPTSGTSAAAAASKK